MATHVDLEVGNLYHVLYVKVQRREPTYLRGLLVVGVDRPKRECVRWNWGGEVKCRWFGTPCTTERLSVGVCLPWFTRGPPPDPWTGPRRDRG